MGVVAEPRPTISVIKAAQLAGVCRRTLYNWMKTDKVEFIRTAGGRRRIFIDTLFRNKDGKPLPAVQ